MSITPKYTLEQLKKLAKNYILFNTDMTRAILDDRKDQTRRTFSKYFEKCIEAAYRLGEIENNGKDSAFDDVDKRYLVDFAPFKVGDILYAREKFQYGKNIREQNIPLEESIDILYYEKEINSSKKVNVAFAKDIKWKPSIHMPKKYARLFIKITSVAIENLQDINQADILAEGYFFQDDIIPFNGHEEEVAKDWWINLWNSTTKDKKYKWDKNPPVFKYKFEVVEYDSTN